MTLALSGFSDLPCHCIDFPDMPAVLLTTMLAVHYTQSTFITSARSILLDSFAAFITSAFLGSFSALCCCNSICMIKNMNVFHWYSLIIRNRFRIFAACRIAHSIVYLLVIPQVRFFKTIQLLNLHLLWLF